MKNIGKYCNISSLKEAPQKSEAFFFIYFRYNGPQNKISGRFDRIYEKIKIINFPALDRV
ncbi:hypothetical protein MNBD_ALPHA02-536 [hydrothermal vent metagenome]|uniref:Uncharacterized protein n=1 Tax=hydrothermal vent metagenome TaxID=652676 RepID=A0A3B0R1L7_9ZZZZ